LIDNWRWPRRIPLAANGFGARNRFHGLISSFSGKICRWRPLSRRNPILTPKAVANAMQTFLLFLALTDPSPRALMIIGAISLGSLAIFLRHKLG